MDTSIYKLSAEAIEARLKELAGVRSSPRVQVAALAVQGLCALPELARGDFLRPCATGGHEYPERTVDRAIALLREAGCLVPVAGQDNGWSRYRWDFSVLTRK